MPRFPLPPVFLPPCGQRKVSFAVEQLLYLVRKMESQPDFERNSLFNALRQTADVAGRIETESLKRSGAVWEDGLWLGSQVNPIAHRLLSTQGNSHEAWLYPISSTIYLGVALFIIIIRQRTQGCPAATTSYISKAIQVLVYSTPSTTEMPSILLTLRLWLLLLCTVPYSDAALLSRIRDLVMETRQTFKLSWEDVLERTRLLPWINRFESCVASVHCYSKGRIDTSL